MRRPSINGLIVTVLVLMTGALVASELADRHPSWSAPISSADRYSRDSFVRWLDEDPRYAADFKRFEGFLALQSVGEVVPAWQLLRTDINDRLGCPRPAFLLPPRKNWDSIVPTLRLVRDHVVPAIGPVEVVSSYRTESFNGCVNGAPQSRHLNFSAVDLVALSERDNRNLFVALCRLHGELGPASRFGLGAYFDPAREGNNRRGRFHIDAAGYRTWGFSKKADSSGCKLLELRNNRT